MTFTAQRKLVAALVVVGLAGAGAAWIRMHEPHQGTTVAQTCLVPKNPARIDEDFIPGGTYDMGTGGRYPEEVLRKGVTVKGFWIDRTEVTNAAFAAFVKATNYVTLAEKIPNAEEFPDMPDDQRVAGGAVFTPPDHVADSDDITQWWHFVPGASWRHPTGPNSSIEGHDNDPVVQIAYADALAYAKWAGRDLPSEAEWEWAARSGSEAGMWDDPQAPPNLKRSNTWQGHFPTQNAKQDGFLGLAPVGCFLPDSHGVYDMIGNAWEWTSDVYHESQDQSSKAHVIKGGSFLCASNYCARYRPAARQAGSDDLSTSHIGFRTIRRSDS